MKTRVHETRRWPEIYFRLYKNILSLRGRITRRGTIQTHFTPLEHIEINASIKTSNYGLIFSKQNNIKDKKLAANFDADWTNDVTDRKSITWIYVKYKGWSGGCQENRRRYCIQRPNHSIEQQQTHCGTRYLHKHLQIHYHDKWQTLESKMITSHPSICYWRLDPRRSQNS